ncbi:MAG: hypothetical protein R2856_08845 [Caldilineaceae bacterium]
MPCGCLGVCASGPILVVYPDGIWYHGVDEERLNRIYREHLLGGRPWTSTSFTVTSRPAGRLRRIAAPPPVDPPQLAAEASATEKEGAEPERGRNQRSRSLHVALQRERRQQRRSGASRVDEQINCRSRRRGDRST